MKEASLPPPVLDLKISLFFLLLLIRNMMEAAGANTFLVSITRCEEETGGRTWRNLSMPTNCSPRSERVAMVTYSSPFLVISNMAAM